MLPIHHFEMDGARTQTRFIGIDAIFQYAGSVAQIFSGLVFYLIAVRLFSLSSIGAIALFLAIVGLFNILFSFGLSTASQHFTSYSLGMGDYDTARKIIYRILFFSVGLSLAGLFTLQILASYISTLLLHSPKYIETVRVLGIVLFGNTMFGILNGVVLGLQRFRLSAIISVIIWVTYYFGAIMFALYMKSISAIVFGWMIGIFTGVIIELIVILLPIKKHRGKGNPPPNLVILKYSVPVLFSSLISYGAAYADRFIVSGLLNLASLGVYNFALLIASAISFLSIPFNNILLPKFSEFFGRGDKEKIRSTAEISATLLSYFYVPSALGIAALSPIILNILAGSEYISGSMPLRIIMFFTALFITQNILIQAIASIKKTRLFLYSSFLSLMGNIIISIVLIPPLGLIGASLGFSSVYVITFAILYYFARKEYVLSLDIKGITKIWLAAILMFSIVNYFSLLFGSYPIYLPFYIFIGTAIYIILTKIMGIFRVESKELILSIFPSKLGILKRLLLLLVLH